MRDGVEGVLVRPGDASSIRESLQRLAGNAALRDSLGAAAARRVAVELTWDRVAGTLEEGYVQAKALAER